MEENLESVIQDAAVDKVQSLNCDDLFSIFGGLSLPELMKMEMKLPSIDLDKIKLDFEINLKIDEMFKDFTIKFPDISIPDLDLSGLFDFLADGLGLPKLPDFKLKIANPLDDILKGLEGIVGFTKDQIDQALANFANCDKFKTDVFNPALGISNEIDKVGLPNVLETKI